MAAPEPTWPGVLLAWPFTPLTWVTSAVLVWGYLRAHRRVPGFPPHRRVFFLLGVAVLFVALGSPVANYDTSLFTVHMVQHLLLTHVAAPLLLLGTPMTLLLRASSPGARARLAKVLHARPLRVLTHPVVAWSLFAVVMWAAHFSPLYDLALRNELVHIAEHFLFLSAGLLFWWPVIGLEPGGHRLTPPLKVLYLVLAIPQQSFLGLALYSAGDVLYASYETARAWGPDPYSDQRAAAIIMWLGGDGLLLAAVVLAILAWMRWEDRETERVDRRLGYG